MHARTHTHTHTHAHTHTCTHTHMHTQAMLIFVLNSADMAKCRRFTVGRRRLNIFPSLLFSFRERERERERG